MKEAENRDTIVMAIGNILSLNKDMIFISSDLLDQNMRCWFNNEFSIVTLPADRNGQNWCLVPNK